MCKYERQFQIYHNLYIKVKKLRANVKRQLVLDTNTNIQMYMEKFSYCNFEYNNLNFFDADGECM